MTFLQDVIRILTEYAPLLAKGVWNTLLIALLGTLLGLIIGFLSGVQRALPFSKVGFLRPIQLFFKALSAVYETLFTNTPLLVQGAVLYWGYAALAREIVPLFPFAVLTISCNCGAALSKSVRTILTAPQRAEGNGEDSAADAAVANTLPRFSPKILCEIALAAGHRLPCNIQDSTVLSILGVTELYYFAGIIRRQIGKSFAVYFLLFLLYFLILFSLSKALALLEKKVRNRFVSSKKKDRSRDAAMETVAADYCALLKAFFSFSSDSPAVQLDLQNPYILKIDGNTYDLNLLVSKDDLENTARKMEIEALWPDISSVEALQQKIREKIRQDRP